MVTSAYSFPRLLFNSGALSRVSSNLCNSGPTTEIMYLVTPSRVSSHKFGIADLSRLARTDLNTLRSIAWVAPGARNSDVSGFVAALVTVRVGR